MNLTDERERGGGGAVQFNMTILKFLRCSSTWIKIVFKSKEGFENLSFL